MKKQRADLLLVEKGLISSRTRAQSTIMQGLVYVGEKRVDKPSELLEPDADIHVREKDPYVSRGAKKLLGAFTDFPIHVESKVAVDVGASTGGFTQVLLEKGATKVYSVDVGYGQLDYRLRDDSRVVNLERQNMRHITADQVSDPIDFFTMDVSFISIKLLMEPLKPLLSEKAQGVILIKPQFEAGKERVKTGVITDPLIHLEVLEEMMDYFKSNGIHVLGLSVSPIKGPKGNIEFLAWVSFTASQAYDIDLKQLVEKAHERSSRD